MAGKRSNGHPAAPRSSVVVVSASDREVRVLQAARRDDGILVQRWCGSPGAPDEAGRARAIAGALAKAGIREKRVVVCLPARSVVIKQVALPPAGKEQLPQLVQFEAQRHLPLPVDELAPGYAVLAPDASLNGKAAAETQVLMAIARRADLMRLEKALAAEGMTVEGYGIDALSLTDAYLSEGPAVNGSARLLLAQDGEGTHAQVVRGSHLLLSRFLSGAPEQCAPELRRSLAAFSLEHPDLHLDEVVLIGDADPAVAEAARAPARRLAQAPAGGAELPPDWGAQAGLARQWLGFGSYGVRIPAQGRQTPGGSRGSTPVIAGLAAAAVLVLGLAGWEMNHQLTMQQESEKAAKEARQTGRDRKLLETLTRRRDRLREQAAAVSASAARTPPIELLREVTTRAPGDVWLTQITYQAGKPVQIEGTTRNQAEVLLYKRALDGVFRHTELGSMQSAEEQQAPVTHFRILGELDESEGGSRSGRLAP